MAILINRANNNINSSINQSNNINNREVSKQNKIDNSIFIIHGHDFGTKETVARFVSNLKLDPIILHEKPNEGKTIIEKFEQYSNVECAIAILTPDDICITKNNEKNKKYRARQNVIFEFGYFIGKLGRKNVIGLKKDDVELPSDYSGVLYISIDTNNGWKLSLAHELKAMGFNIDMNLVF